MKLIKKSSFILWLILTGIIFTSCAKKDIHIDLTSHEWEVVKIRYDGESSYTKAEASYILTFTNENTYAINLDVNQCFGSYEITGSGNIDIGQGGCTMICCDSKFAMQMLKLLPEMTSYYGQGDELTLEGEDGNIILKEK
jgi:heat shock protein HslJ